jgi:hypothetical protein
VKRKTLSSNPLLRSICHFTSPSILQEGNKKLELAGKMGEVPGTIPHGAGMQKKKEKKFWVDLSLFFPSSTN